MRITIECLDFVNVLCRVLDQLRRMDIPLESVSAVSSSADGFSGSVDLCLRDTARRISPTLRDRIGQISGVSRVELGSRRDQLKTSEAPC